MTGENIDLTSEPEGLGPGKRPVGRRFLGVQFACCDVYSRVYVNRDATAYAGACPRCGQKVRFTIGPEGTMARFFRAE